MPKFQIPATFFLAGTLPGSISKRGARCPWNGQWDLQKISSCLALFLFHFKNISTLKTKTAVSKLLLSMPSSAEIE